MRRNRQPKGFLASQDGLKNLQAKKLEKGYNYEKIRQEACVTLDQVKRLFNPHWDYKIGREAIEHIARVLDLHPRDIVGCEWDSPVAIQETPQAKVEIDWRGICNQMLKSQRELSSNSLLHAYKDSQFERQQIYVPLALIERKKPDKREGAGDPETGTKLYEPEYEEKQRFDQKYASLFEARNSNGLVDRSR
ncbi:hypothetical protein [Merismopedia glauca]|uniref:Uncharacterized protein n=1 Tax=Merismopedia glauca CCAP 1448/3 TaxID=1296344 RepID=A0A2T1BZ70_9CYAN|nr:hypothetical protein [Merismopedia glauca]PSB01330.1 hypothetical protein C7B64_18880 [Merismopedia glauca CCAP 1448/3]